MERSLGTNLDLFVKVIQQERIDFEETFAPVAGLKAIRIFLALLSF